MALKKSLKRWKIFKKKNQIYQSIEIYIITLDMLMILLKPIEGGIYLSKEVLMAEKWSTLLKIIDEKFSSLDKKKK